MQFFHIASVTTILYNINPELSSLFANFLPFFFQFIYIENPIFQKKPKIFIYAFKKVEIFIFCAQVFFYHIYETSY